MILKKQASILLTFFVLISNLGLAFNVHYCEDKIESITLSTSPVLLKVIDECCGIVNINLDCCVDKVIKAEIKSDQIIKNTLLLDFIAINNFWNSGYYIRTTNFQDRAIVSFSCVTNIRPLYLLHKQHTFYC